MAQAAMEHAMDGNKNAADERSFAPAREAGQSSSVRDPVCGMAVDPHTTPHRHTHHGHTYSFCSAGCRTKFAREPDAYLSPAEHRSEPPAGTIYTCPMHPEVRQVGPGACPICGMALEPELAAPDSGPNPELADMW